MDDTILQLTNEFMQIKEKLSKVSALKTLLEGQKKNKEYELFNAMENNNIQSFKHDTFGLIYLSRRVWCKIVDFDKACLFLKERGVFDEIMKLEAKTGRLNDLIKAEYLDKKGVIPETEIGITATIAPMIGTRAPKKGGELVQELESEGL